jgi:hypothetical protein
MQKITVLSGQSLFDIAIQYTGDVANAFAIALLNQISVTDNLSTQNLVLIPDSLITATREIKYLKSVGVIPATAITLDQQTVMLPELGIGTMTIGTTFIVE